MPQTVDRCTTRLITCGLISIITLVQADAQTRKLQPAAPKAQTVLHGNSLVPTVSATESLSGIKSLSIKIDNYFEDEKKEIRNRLIARLEEMGIDILPDGRYPVLTVDALGTAGQFYIGAIPHTIYGTYIRVSVQQLLPLGDRLVEATTYSTAMLASGLYTQPDSLRAEAINHFFKDLQSVHPHIEAAPLPMASAEITYQDTDVLTRDSWNGAYASTGLDWSKQKKDSWNEQTKSIFADASYRVLYCRYIGENARRQHIFWYKTSPPVLTAAFAAEFPNSLLSEIGSARTACPANAKLAGKLF